ncbi:AAA family ATPase [Microcoleus sp. B3-A4]|uniref:AAA family ATPase n=1 Tax=unclassified Microcoleus TaxID=2642155 RepID=UPI002FCE8A93
MQGKRFIRTLRLKNFLSYGSEGEEIELQPLNVLIGPNASGKSNLIDAVGILQSTPNDINTPFRQGGGIGEWLWKGDEKNSNNIPTATIEATVDYPEEPIPLRYQISFTMVGQKLEIVDEAVENEEKFGPSYKDVYFFYRYQNGNPVLNIRKVSEEGTSTYTNRGERHLRRDEINPSQSVLSQKQDKDFYPELAYLNNQFSNIRIYREWNLGRYTPPRKPQPSDLPNDFLEEDASNLAHVLLDLDFQGIKPLLIEQLQKFYEAVGDITARLEGSTIQTFLRDKKFKRAIPATRLSDGTLRYLCLLTLLCHPSPPPLICIEEPELGLHPDILSTVAELLIAASKRTQIIVTTHSDALVSGLSEVPESVLVCEQNNTGSHLRRLEPQQLKKWLEKYTLGDLWRMGHIGGNRW